MEDHQQTTDIKRSESMGSVRTYIKGQSIVIEKRDGANVYKVILTVDEAIQVHDKLDEGLKLYPSYMLWGKRIKR